ncbi:MAG: glycosyl hydrolase family protein, partial [Chloroflexi bacterium]
MFGEARKIYVLGRNDISREGLMFNKNHQLSVMRFAMILVLLIGLLGVTPINSALASTITVTTTSDSGPGSLRQVIAEAASGDTIAFDPSLAGQTITLASNLVIDKDLTIDGSGLSPQVTVSGGNVAHLEISGATEPTVTISDLTIADGYTSGSGGAISSSITGNLIVINSTLRNNHAVGDGGAIASYQLTLKNTTVYQNQADSDGGAFAFDGNAEVAIVSSTVSDNHAGDSGGAIYMAGNAEAAIYNNTFVGNSAPQGSELRLRGLSFLALHNTIFVCAPGSTSCYATAVTSTIDYSIDSILGAGTLFDYGLGELDDNGGPTLTMALLPGSSLVDAGDDTICTSPPVNNLDQRGVARPQGAHCDIGAYEMEDTIPPAVVSFDPENEALNIPLDKVITIHFSEEIDPATVTDSSLILMPFHRIESTPATISTTGSMVTLTPNDPLEMGTTYWIRVTTGVTDMAGNSLGQTRLWLFTTGPNGVMDTTTADFAAANPDSCYVSNIENGEVTEIPVIGEEFSGTSLPAGWAASGPAIVGNDKISVESAMAYYSTPFAGDHRLRFAAIFGIDPSQQVGLIGNIDFSGQWAVFGKNDTLDKLYAMTSDGQSTLIPGNFIGTKHTYEIDWRANSVIFYVDGLPVATHTIALTNLRPMLSDSTPDEQALGVEWMHFTPYSSPCIFTSRVFDSGQVVDWLNLGWWPGASQGTACIATHPSDPPICTPNYGFTIETRTGNTATPNETWSNWEATDFAVASPNGRYLQYRATLSSDTSGATMQLYSVVATYLALPATIHYVNQDATGANDGSSWTDAYIDLQSALSASLYGDEIWVAAGTYTPTPGTDRTISFTLRNGISIYGGFTGVETEREQRDPAANVTILSGDLNGDDVDFINNGENSYHVVIGSGTDGSAVLDGFTIRGGNANGADPDDSGGGMYNNDGSPTLTNAIFSRNTAIYRGAMYNENSSPALTNVIFSGNTAAYGGGMFNLTSSSPTLTNVTFSGNTADMGGGMFNLTSSSPTLTNVTFSDNTAIYKGGGMSNGDSNPTLTNVIFSSNSTTYYGGGIYNYAGSPTLTNVTFTGNKAYKGGGMLNDASSPTLTNVTFTSNATTTYGYGGGIYNYNSEPTLTNATLSNNTALQGGGIYNESGSPSINDVILWGNGTEVYNAGSAPIIKDSVVQGGCPSGATCTNIITDNPLLGLLADNGGYAQTMALGSGSSAVDAGGVNSTCADTDQRGVSRPQDGDNNGSAICDIGAYEKEFVSSAIADFDGDGDTDLSVFKVEPWAGMWYVKDQDAHAYGNSESIPVSCDYNGDGQTDVAVYNAGTWYVEGLFVDNWGDGDSIPVPGDYDGDGSC